MNYQFTKRCHNKSPEEIWQFLQHGLSNNVIIKSIKDELPYTVNYVTSLEISFSAASRNEGTPEIIRLEDFIIVINSLKDMKVFNTASAKEMFKGTKIYKKRSPFFALLLSGNVIEKI